MNLAPSDDHHDSGPHQQLTGQSIAQATTRCYLHHRFWCSTFEAAAESAKSAARQVRLIAIAHDFAAEAQRYAEHLRLLNAPLPNACRGLGPGFVRWLIIHSRGVGSRFWTSIARARAKNLRRAVLRLHGVWRNHAH